MYTMQTRPESNVMATTQITVDEFWQLFQDQHKELVNGSVIDMAPTGGLHGATESRLAMYLLSYVLAHSLGEVLVGEVGFALDALTLRAADVAFVSRDKWLSVTEPDKYIPFAPDLAVEILSPSNDLNDIRRKVLQYIGAGTRLVWVINPSTRQIVVYKPDSEPEMLGENDDLDGYSVLPGFRLAVAKLFTE